MKIIMSIIIMFALMAAHPVKAYEPEIKGIMQVGAVIDDSANPSCALGGEIGANMSFEYALHRFRKEPTTYNKALLFFSGTDFLWYSVYAFYFNEDNPDADPNILHRETGISQDAILAAAVTQSLLNGYRVYSGSDNVIPYMSFNKDSIGFHVKVSF